MNIFENVYTKKNVHHFSEAWGFAGCLVLILIGYATRYNIHEALPNALGNADLLQTKNRFIAERAWKDLTILTNFGPRPTGTYSNEILTVDFLKREISHIKQTAHRNQRVELEVQVVSGSFWRDGTPFGMTSIYRNVQNIIVKLHGDPNSNVNRSLLLNSHYDSVAGSPGASDDAANCVVMLEVLRVLSRRSDLNRHSIIFLFNGAEETGLQASHGFITQHKWAAEVKAFINLESAGSGGKELLFQSSPNNSWLIELYGKSVPHPNAQVVAEEIFQSGLIPSDTDFRIFQKYGAIPGLDFAYYINGYRYHTKFDHIDYISKDSLQHTGDNVLELAKAAANCEKLDANHNHISGSQVYFDIFGYFFVNYSNEFSKIFNYIVVSCAVIIPYILLSQATIGINRSHLRYEIFLGFLINMISLVASNALCYAIAYDLDLSGKSMAWYTNTFLCIPIYCITTVFLQCVVHLIFSNRRHCAPLSIALQTQARLIGTCLFWGILAASLTGAGIRTAYAIIIPLLITLLSHIVNGIMGYQNSIRKWLYVHLVGQIVVIFWTTNFYNMVIDVFIPILGRSGGRKNPDAIIAFICASMTLFITSYLSPLIILFRKNKNFLVTLFAVYIVTRYYIVPHTYFGFPYLDDAQGQPRIQRHYITHTVRTLYDREGSIRYTDSGFWMLNMDRNSRKTIESLTLPEIPKPQDENILCKNEIFCGLPMYSMNQFHMGGYWVSGPAPLLRDVAGFKLISHEIVSPTVHRMNFLLTGSHLLSLQIRPKDSVQLQKWNLMSYIPEGAIHNKQKTFFAMISHGLESESLNVTLEFKTKVENYSRSLVDITLVTHHLEYHKEHTAVFANMLSKLPQWAYAVPSVASLQTWTF